MSYEIDGWRNDFHEFLQLFRQEGKLAPWVKWSGGFLLMTAALVAGLLLFLQGAREEPAPLETPSVSETPAPSETPVSSPTPSENPPKPTAVESFFSRAPGLWNPTSLEGCGQGWTADARGISSVLLLEASTEAFREAGLKPHSSWGTDSLTVSGSNSQNGAPAVEMHFTPELMSLCLR